MSRARFLLPTVGLLALLARGAQGQRLAPAFRGASARVLTDTTRFLRTRVGSSHRPLDCRMPSALRVPFDGLAGVAGGWLAYEVTLGIWVSAEGAKPDATVRRIRGKFIAAGAILGIARGVYMSRQCHSN